MNQYKTFIALGLSGLIGVSPSFAGDVIETSDGLIFKPTISVYDKPFSVTSGVKKIILEEGTSSARMSSGINVSTGAQLDVIMNGYYVDELRSVSQTLSLLGGTSISIEKKATANFLFKSMSGHTAEYTMQHYGYGDTTYFQNQGEINFVLEDNVRLYPALSQAISTDAVMNIRLGNSSGLINAYFNMTGGDYNVNMTNVRYAYVLNGRYKNTSSGNNGVLNFNLSNAKNSQINFNPPTTQSLKKSVPEIFINLQSGSSATVDLGEGTTLSTRKHGYENVQINMAGENNSVFLKNNYCYSFIRWIQADPNNHLSFTQSEYDFKNNYFSLAEIGEYGNSDMGLSGNGLNFIVAINPLATESHLGWLETPNTFSDKFVIHSGSEGIHNIGATLKAGVPLSSLSLVQYHNKPEAQEGEYLGDTSVTNNILVASVAKNSNITLNPIQNSIVGFNLVSIGFVEVDTDESGIHHGDSQDTYTSYFLSGAKDLGVSVVNQEITTTALALNYDLFIGNFNSLNKRMGDLRNNPYNQGAWGRIFNGQISNDFTSSKNNYTTIQLGYDHKLGNFENASNYLGVAIDYSFAFSESSINASNALQSRTIQDVYSNAFEVAIYNSYIQDEGWFSDSIAKFSYLDSSFNITDNLANTNENQNTSNVAFTLSEEFGYRFKLGENKTWFVDPQLEVAMGYFSGTDLKQVAGSYFLDAKSDGMFMTRARFGASAGYDFKDFTQGKDFKAVVYAGLSCEADLLSGGDVTLTPSSGQGDIVNSLYSSDFRGVLNIGTNVEIQENIRVYADIQTSFGGKISNDYQINLGARFSFGEKGESNVLVEKKNAQ